MGCSKTQILAYAILYLHTNKTICICCQKYNATFQRSHRWDCCYCSIDSRAHKCLLPILDQLFFSQLLWDDTFHSHNISWMIQWTGDVGSQVLLKYHKDALSVILNQNFKTRNLVNNKREHFESLNQNNR